MLLSFINMHVVYIAVFVHVTPVNTVSNAVFMNVATVGLYIFMTVALAAAFVDSCTVGRCCIVLLI
jgi:hypothetical protein